MKAVPAFFRKEFSKIHFGLQNTFPIGQFPPLRQAMDVGVNWKSRFAKSLADHNTRRLATYAGKRLQSFKIIRDLALVIANENFR